MRQKAKKQKTCEKRANYEDDALFGTHIRETIQEFRRLFGKQREQKDIVRRR